ncbi:TonB-dependent receptor [Flavobacterium sp. LHD-80]|uniref:TonB-dependent receptor n=1 Tax=Flavobacterium sp. LHD-80 TaxID=3071411 RepID=UPI0027DF7844|nr:TonB-dependent receptor [Flavobacterium sp. LHD-80]MDQ6469997.1 TonB-dependent receptor [Flavobacterium sp. LHD-80]
MRLLYHFVFCLIPFFCFSQTRTISGIITSDDSNVLENANVIAFPKSKKNGTKFVITDNKGRFKLELEIDEDYQITISHIGFNEQIVLIESNSKLDYYQFKLVRKEENLKEIIIQHNPIIIKKDTITYSIKSFTNGRERKMKELLEKLPGVEVDKNGEVTVQGKKVTQMLVEGKPFFGGGSKLAVENIPADALDKIEVIDHFNQVGLLKQVSDSDELAMNVKLKEDKKKFVFGDVEAGAEAGNDDNKFYLGHTALFYYSPKTNISFIGDLNNVGKRVFTYQDLSRFQGGSSSFIEKRKSLTNLFSFTRANNDVILNNSQFAAFNFSNTFSSKVSFSCFGIFSKILTKSKIETYNEYLENSNVTFENKTQKGNNESILGIYNLKLDYAPNKKNNWFYNLQFQLSTNDLVETINSITNANSTLFETIQNADNSSIKQYLEWHKKYNTSHTTTLAINQQYEYATPNSNWITDQPFFEGSIPIEKDSIYSIKQLKRVQNNNIDVLFKHYWILNDFNHIYSSIGNNFETSHFLTDEMQNLTNGTSKDFSQNSFGNDVKYKMNDSYLGIEYKNKIGKLKNRIGLFLHHYQLNTNQFSGESQYSQTKLLPQLNSDYQFNNSESLSLTYKLANNFPTVNQLAEQYTLQSYNLIYRGNANLRYEQYHFATLRYSKMDNYRKFTLDAGLNFNQKIKTIRNEVVIDGINQYNTPILTNNPETNYSFNGSFGKDIYRLNIKLISNISWFNYLQTLNEITTSNNRNNQKVGIWFKTAYKKWPDFKVGYTKGFGQFSGLTNSSFNTTTINSDLAIQVFPSWNFRLSYEAQENIYSSQQSNFYNVTNTAINYQKKNNPFFFELSINNFFNNKTKNEYSFLDYVISERNTYIMPRVILFTINYKL